jgi:hypothetical protein
MFPSIDCPIHEICDSTVFITSTHLIVASLDDEIFEIVDGEAENLKYAINNPMKTTKIEMNCRNEARTK